jgi:hypothetical protein
MHTQDIEVRTLSIDFLVIGKKIIPGQTLTLFRIQGQTVQGSCKCHTYNNDPWAGSLSQFC